MAEKLRVGVIGAGAIAQIMHLPYLTDYDDLFEVVALADSYAPALEAVADRFAVPHRYTDWRELLARDDIEAVIICHSGSHRETALAANAAGKHILVEKPLTWNAREAEEVYEQLKDSPLTIQLAYHKRYDPGFAVARDAIAQMTDKGLARITVLHPANELGFSPHRIRRGNGIIEEGHIDPGTWDGQVAGQLKAFASGALSPLVDEALGDRANDQALRLAMGNITISLTHQIYMMYGLLGAPERVISTDVWRDGLSFHVVVQYPNDLMCTLDWHFLSHLKNYQEEYLIAGNFERVRLDMSGPYYRNFPSPVTIEGGQGEMAWEKRVTASLDEAFRNELLHFHDCVVNGRTPDTPLHEGLVHMRFVQEIIDAIR